ncbi:MAG: 30S ribosomal protein S27e [Candidatus Aenigmatarchaeota archaeon]
MPGKFLLVRCKKCKNEQVVFSMAKTIVKCLICGEILAEPRGGKAKIKTTVIGSFK